MLVSVDQIQALEELQSKLQRSGKDFIDGDFLPQLDIVLSNRDSTPEKAREWPDLQLKKAAEAFTSEQPTVLPSKIMPGSIQSGALLDTYLTSSLRVLSEHPQLINKLFPLKRSNSNGLYCVWLNDNGEWRLVTLDDSLPTVNKEGECVLAFSHSDDGSLWVPLLEKAYAKIYGGYVNIQYGYPEDALRDLTGAPCDVIQDCGIDQLWDRIYDAISKKFLVAGCTPVSESESNQIENGLLGSHAYSVIGVREVKEPQGTRRLLQVRNPNGDSESTSLGSSVRVGRQSDLRKNLQVESSDLGVFWMDARDYVRLFEATCILRFNPNYSYYSVNLNHHSQNYTVLRLKVSKASDITLSLNQRDERYFTDSYQGYSYSCSRILAARVETGGELKYVTGAHECERNLQTSAQFETGEYIVVLEVHWNQPYHHKFNFSVYTEHSVQLEGMETTDLLLIQKNILKSIINDGPPTNQQTNNYSQLELPDAVRKVGYVHGLVYYYYTNTSATPAKILESVKVSGKNLVICHPYTDDSKFDLTLLPQSEEIVLYKITSGSWSWKTVYTFFRANVGINEHATQKDIYIDKPGGRYELQVNTSYNDYIREDYILPSVLPSKESLDISGAKQDPLQHKDPITAIPAQDIAVVEYDTLVEQLQSTKGIFTDQSFPPDLKSSLCYSLQAQKDWSDLYFQRYMSIPPLGKLFEATIEPKTISSRDESFAYFSSAVAALIDRTDIVKRLYRTTEINENGIYAIWICLNGQWELITVDDHIPLNAQGRIAFSFST